MDIVHLGIERLLGAHYSQAPKVMAVHVRQVAPGALGGKQDEALDPTVGMMALEVRNSDENAHGEVHLGDGLEPDTQLLAYPAPGPIATDEIAGANGDCFARFRIAQRSGHPVLALRATLKSRVITYSGMSAVTHCFRQNRIEHVLIA